MSDNFSKRLLVITITLLQLFTMPGVAQAQSADIEPPIIGFEAVSSGNAGDSQVFAATVADNSAVAEVTLYYRFAESTPYQRRSLSMLGNSGIFTVTLSSDELPVSATFIQYYIEAFDAAGNRALVGFAFDPIERQLVTPDVPVAQTPIEPVESSGMSFNRKLIYGAVGLLVVGVLASAGGGGGSSSAGVPVTVVVDQLP